MTNWHDMKRMWVIYSWPWCWLVWPWWGGRMYQIVTGVTSDIGVPSTYLVCLCLCLETLQWHYLDEEHLFWWGLGVVAGLPWWRGTHLEWDGGWIHLIFSEKSLSCSSTLDDKFYGVGGTHLYLREALTSIFGGGVCVFTIWCCKLI